MTNAYAHQLVKRLKDVRAGHGPDADFIDPLSLEAANYINQLQSELAAARAFKAYVHKRLDEAGIATHPDGPHSKEGCRVGDRLDIVLAARAGNDAVKLKALLWAHDIAKNFTPAEHVAFDMRMGRFPKQSPLNEAIAETILELEGPLP